MAVLLQRQKEYSNPNSKAGRHPVLDHMTCTCSCIPRCSAARLAARARAAAGLQIIASAFKKLQLEICHVWSDVEASNDWDQHPCNLNVWSKFNLNFRRPKLVQLELALQARRRPLHGGRSAAAPLLRLPELSGQYCPGKLGDAKGQADLSQQLLCCP